MGHKGRTITSRYIHSADAVLLSAADAIADQTAGLMAEANARSRSSRLGANPHNFSVEKTRYPSLSWNCPIGSRPVAEQAERLYHLTLENPKYRPTHAEERVRILLNKFQSLHNPIMYRNW